MSFWDNVFAAPEPQQRANQPVSQARAWWQDEPQQVYQQNVAPSHALNYPQQQGMSQQDIAAIRKRGHDNISAEEAEAIAEYDLATKAKYQNVCDQCGSGNFIVAGTRVAGVVMPTNKCFNCGNSARSPEPAVGGGSGSGSTATRQIDTGGGGGSMFMKFNGVPRTYAPRS
jgi:hypothetical protein